MAPHFGLINADELTMMADGWMQHELPLQLPDKATLEKFLLEEMNCVG